MSEIRQNDLELLYQALAAPIGIVCRTDDVDHAQQKLYKARRDSGDEDLKILQFRTSPVVPQEEIWIIKRTIKAEDLNGPSEGE